MTVPAPGPLTYSYSEDGVTTIFAYPVRFIEAQELVVIRTVGGVATTLTMGVDYTVSGIPAFWSKTPDGDGLRAVSFLTLERIKP